jgi:CcmD family protein
MKFLFAAYVVTWLVHLSYFTRLARGYKRVYQEIKELERR